MSKCVRIEVLALGNLHTIWRLEMIASHDVINVVDSSRS